MKLFYIDSGKTRHMFDVVKGIKAVAQLEQEFAPYLHLIYLPRYEGQEQGVILQTHNEAIRRNYTFETENDINNLRNLIWHYLLKENPNIKVDNCDTGNTGNTGVYKNDSYYGVQFDVVEGWQAKKRMMNKAKCCKKFINNPQAAIDSYNILADRYKFKTDDIQDRNICKKVRYQICDQSYPLRSPGHDYCMKNTTLLCDNGYPNKIVDLKNQYVKDTQNNLYKYLENNDYKVDKQKFDEIMNAGMFDNLHLHPGNMSSKDLKEGFSDSDYNITTNKTYGLIILVMILLVLMCMYQVKN